MSLIQKWESEKLAREDGGEQCEAENNPNLLTVHEKRSVVFYIDDKIIVEWIEIYMKRLKNLEVFEV